MSDRASAGSPRTCSGAMYPTVPRSVPASVAFASVGDFVSSPAVSGALLGEAEVEDLRAAVLREDDVLGLEVPVDDPAFVRRRETARDLHAELHGLADRQGSRRDPLAQRLAVHELHDEDGDEREKRKEISSNE